MKIAGAAIRQLPKLIARWNHSSNLFCVEIRKLSWCTASA